MEPRIFLEKGEPSTLARPTSERILIADDNPANLLLLRRILAREPVGLLVAKDGQAALDMARAHRPDLVLLDVMMPELDGYEVAAALKGDAETADVPILFLSALDDASSKVKGLEVGAVDYITKPFDRDEVLARVRNQLSLRRLTRELRRANDELCARQRRLDEDLCAAAEIQRSLLPARPPATDRIRVAWRFLPCERNAGDLFAFHQLTQRDFAFHVIDVSGHGVPAAMMTVALSQSLAPDNGHTRRLPGDGGLPTAIPPIEVLRRLDAEYPIERFGRHFTIAYLVLELTSGLLRYGRAGHPMPLLLRRDGAVERLSAGGTIIGLGGREPSEQGECRLQAGDRLFVYTDGIPEATNPEGASFGDEAFGRALRETLRLSLDDACERIVDAVQRFGRGRSFEDDVTLFAIEYAGDTAGGQPRASGVDRT